MIVSYLNKEQALIRESRRYMALVEMGERHALRVQATGSWRTSPDAGGDIRRSLHSAAVEIYARHGAGVFPLICLICPLDANAMANSQEIGEGFRRGIFPAIAHKNAPWGLPDVYQGFELIVLTHVAMRTPDSRHYVKAIGSALMISKAEYLAFVDLNREQPKSLNAAALIEGITA